MVGTLGSLQHRRIRTRTRRSRNARGTAIQRRKRPHTLSHSRPMRRCKFAAFGPRAHGKFSTVGQCGTDFAGLPKN